MNQKGIREISELAKQIEKARKSVAAAIKNPYEIRQYYSK